MCKRKQTESEEKDCAKDGPGLFNVMAGWRRWWGKWRHGFVPLSPAETAHTCASQCLHLWAVTHISLPL